MAKATKSSKATKKIPPCAKAMGCLCAGHARGNPANAPCDTTEQKPDTSYNGWKNYETWAVALWIDNDEGSYNKSWRMVLAAKNEADESKAEVEDTGRGIAREAKGILADALKEWMNAEAPNLGATLWADLLGAALSEVDWYEIAAAFLADGRES